MVVGGSSGGGGGGGAKGGSSSSAAAAPASAGGSKARDAWYTFNTAKLDEVMAAKPWGQDPKYFKKVRISPSAAMKMLMHSCSGVERGMKAGGKPVEVMGLMIGRPDTESLTTLVVTDVYALPVEGFETRVIADDIEVLNYMIKLSESLELTRKEKFMGWYHSHPFDVEVYSHCHLSGTDVQTQLAWQRAQDVRDFPWLAIVVDPLRSLAKNKPEFGAFRVYPPEFAAPQNETPDGKIVTDDNARIERWGTYWNRYYSLEIEYYMSTLSSNIMSILTENFLWMRTLGTTPQLEPENAERFSERIGNVADKLEQCAVAEQAGGGGGAGGHLGGGLVSGESSSHGGGSKEESAVHKSTQNSLEIALEQNQSQLSQVVKNVVMN